MQWKKMTFGALAFAMLAAGSARADLIVGAPVIAPANAPTAVVEFVSFEANFAGQLFFLGTGTEFAVTNPAPNSGPAMLGQFLFNNQVAAPGEQVTLDLTLQEGDYLHFAYKVIQPGHENIFKTNLAPDQVQFAYDAGDGTFAIEDIPVPSPATDYNDAVVQITFIPAPGAAALLLLAGVVGTRRRRG
jgi:uncharacterized protein (TIGR03382 family)